MTGYLDTLHQAEREFASAYRLDPAPLDGVHRTRLKLAVAAPGMVEKIAVFVAAPVLAGFAGWMAQNADRKSPPLYLGVMREGGLLAELMRRLHGIPARTVWLNRDTAMRAAFGCGDEEALLNWLARTRLRPLTRGEAHRQLLGADTDDHAAGKPLELAGARQLLADWRGNGKLEAASGRAHALARRLLLHWQKASQQQPVLLMDFASAGNIQRSLRTVLAANRQPAPLIGLNFSLTAGSRWAEAAGCVMRGYLAERGEPHWFAAACARTPELMELFAADAGGSLEEYDDKGEPIIGPPFLDQHRTVLLDSLRRDLSAAAAQYHNALAEISADTARCLWGRLLLRPLREEAEALAAWPLDAGLDGRQRRLLAARGLAQPEPWDKMQTAWPAASRLLR